MAALLLALGSALPARAQAGCAALAKAYPELRGRTLMVGIAPAPAHYSSIDPADPEKIIGIEPDLLHTAAKCLGFRFRYSILDFSGLVPALHTGRLQIIAAGMYASAERAQQANFVEYMKAREASLVRAGNPKHLTALNRICNVTAAEVVGTVEGAMLTRQSEQCERTGKGRISALQYPSTDRAVSALAQGRADILLTDAGVAAFLSGLLPDRVTVGFQIATDLDMGFGVSKQEPRLAEALRASIQAQYDDGSLARELARWGFAPEQLRAPAVRTH